MGTSEKVPILAWIEREGGHTLPPSQSPHASPSFAAQVCLQTEAGGLLTARFGMPKNGTAAKCENPGRIVGEGLAPSRQHQAY